MKCVAASTRTSRRTTGGTVGSSGDPDAAARRSARPRRPRGRRCSSSPRRSLGVAGGEPDRRQGRRLGRRQDGHLRRAARRQAVQRARCRPRRRSTRASHRTKPVSQYKLVGKQRVPRVDIPDKVDRQVHLRRTTSGCRGCCTAASCGRAARAPTATARRRRSLSVDESSIKHIPGAQVVRSGDFLGVVAPTGVRRDPGGGAAEGEVGRARRSLPGTGNLWKRCASSDAAGRRRRDHGRTRATSTTAFASAR